VKTYEYSFEGLLLVSALQYPRRGSSAGAQNVVASHPSPLARIWLDSVGKEAF